MQLLDIHEPGHTPSPHETPALPEIAIGIDLGTTHSLVAVIESEKATIIPDEKGRNLCPSVVAYTEKGEVIVGHEALREEVKGVVIRSVKRLMGKGKEDIKRVMGEWPFPFATEDAQSTLPRLDVGGNRQVTAVEVSAEILRKLKRQAEEQLKKEISHAVITVPAYFDDAARAATKDAAALAGLTVLRLVNEPTAAALAYGLDQQVEGTYLVYDLGGGTFDVSLLKMEKGVFQVLATGGDTALGGDDIDAMIAEHWLKDIVTTPLSQLDLHNVLKAARDVKERLSTDKTASVRVSVQGTEHHWTLDQQALISLITPLITRTVRIAHNVCDDAGWDVALLQGIVLVGGSTRIPLIGEMIEKAFGHAPHKEVDPDLVVAFGAATQAHGLVGGGRHLLLDVIPLSLGIETMGGIVEKIILRHSTIPLSVAQEFTTYQDGQTGMQFHVVQGEREMAADCRSLAHFTLKGIPPMKASVARVRVTFTVDGDGLLTVSAEEAITATRQEIAVKPTYGLPEAEMASMLRDAMKHAQADMEQRLLTETRVEAEQSLLVVEKALKADGALLTESERISLQKEMTTLKETLTTGDRVAIRQQQEALEKAVQILASKQLDAHVTSALKGMTLDELEERTSHS